MNGDDAAFEAELASLVHYVEVARRTHPVGLTDVESQIARVLTYLEPGGAIIRSAPDDEMRHAMVRLSNELTPFSRAMIETSGSLSESVARGAYDRLLNVLQEFLRAWREPRRLVIAEDWEDYEPGVPARLYNQPLFRYSLAVANLLLTGEDRQKFIADLFGNYDARLAVHGKWQANVWATTRVLVWCGGPLGWLFRGLVFILTVVFGAFFAWVAARILSALFSSFAG